MTIQFSSYWNAKIVASFLEEAAAIHRRLPEVRVPQYSTLWPATLRDESERLLEMIHGKNTLGSPFAAEVTFSEKIMEWLRLLERQQQVLVWMRANLVPWDVVIEECGKSKSTLWRERERSLGKMVTYLNRIDPKGEQFRHLRSRARGYETH